MINKDYIRINTSISDDPRILRISGALGIPIHEAIGAVCVTACLFANHADQYGVARLLGDDLDEYLGRDRIHEIFFEVGLITETSDGYLRFLCFEDTKYGLPERPSVLAASRRNHGSDTER